MLPRLSRRSSPRLPSTRSSADRTEGVGVASGGRRRHGRFQESSKDRKPGKPAAATPRNRAANAPEHGEARDDADLRMRIARRAYEISQGEDAGDDADQLAARRARAT